jgi:hypothetical protein
MSIKEGDSVQHRNLQDFYEEPEPKLNTGGIDEASGIVTQVCGDWVQVDGRNEFWPAKDLIVVPDETSGT